MQVEPHVRIGVGQRNAHTGQALPKGTYVQLEFIALNCTVHADQILKVAQVTNAILWDGEDVRPASEQVDFNEMRLAVQHFGLLGKVEFAAGPCEFVGWTQHFNGGNHSVVQFSINDIDERLGNFQLVHADSRWFIGLQNSRLQAARTALRECKCQARSTVHLALQRKHGFR